MKFRLLDVQKYKFDKYCKMFSEWFNDEKPTFEKINYNKLIDMIFEKYNDMDLKQRKVEELLLNDRINEYNFMKINFDIFITIILTLIISMVAGSLSKISGEDGYAYYKIFTRLVLVFTGAITYFLIFESRSKIRDTINRGFYALCLNILQDVIKEELESKQEYLKEIAATNEDDMKAKLDDITQDIKSIKRYIGIK
ncbi:hypothetical protein [uncultured Clostridium sp.]|uniref:hypothetical protein n=1 Tax=uncultured Clostridium sp. TaxID=59620 RepID=UPI0028E8BFA3|nr:hypothetical protein [uncultured Clostridium sp.]